MTATKIYRGLGFLFLAAGLISILAYFFIWQSPVLLLLTVIFLLDFFIWYGIAFFLNRRQKQRQHIQEFGIQAEGVIQDVRVNRGYRINRRYPYSVVEYTFQDMANQTHTIKDKYVAAEHAQYLQAGKRIAIKYLAENPQQSVIVE